MGFTVGILTVSDRCSRGEEQDRSGPFIAQWVSEHWAAQVVKQGIVPDERPVIAAKLIAWSDGDVDLILTTGGTGFAPRDVTPEASFEVIDRPAPGIAEAIRADSIAKTPHGLLSRGIAGVRDRTLVVNLPGSPGGCRDGFAVLQPALGHALELLAGEQTAHRQT